MSLTTLAGRQRAEGGDRAAMSAVVRGRTMAAIHECSGIVCGNEAVREQEEVAREEVDDHDPEGEEWMDCHRRGYRQSNRRLRTAILVR